MHGKRGIKNLLVWALPFVTVALLVEMADAAPAAEASKTPPSAGGAGVSLPGFPPDSGQTPNASHKLGGQGQVLGQGDTAPRTAAVNPAAGQERNSQGQQAATPPPASPPGQNTAQNAARDPAQDPQALFEESLRQMMPLSKDQIQEYRKWSDQRDRALLPATPALRSRTARVVLEPGGAPVTVATTGNIATSLVFHDSTGQPWPITSVTNGAPQFFQILRPELPEGNLLNVMPVQAYGAANIVVTFAKQDIPLVIRLESDSVRGPERKADGLVLFQLAHYGPNAQPPLIKGINETASSAMLAFLDHVPPSGAVRVRTEPKDEKLAIWKFQDQHYIRTSHTLMWPAWTAAVNGAGGMKCYEAPVTPRLLLSRDGAIEPVVIKGGTE